MHIHLLPRHQVEALVAHAVDAFPREASGLLLERPFGRFTLLSLAPLSSRGNTPVSFRIADAEIELELFEWRGDAFRRARLRIDRGILHERRPSDVLRPGGPPWPSV